MAMEHPDAGIVRDHVCHFHRRWQQFHHVRAMTVFQDRVPVPMRRVQVRFRAHPQQVPAHALALGHGHQRQVRENVTVDRVLLVALDEQQVAPIDRVRRAECFDQIRIKIPALALIENIEERNELAIHVVR